VVPAGHRELWAGKHETTGLNFQVVIDAWRQLVTISQPIGGCAHDMRALQESGLQELLALADAVFADKGYKGSGYFTPRKKPAGGELTDTQKQHNAQISASRVPVERAIATIKVWRILHTDYRRPLKTFQDTFHAVIELNWFTLSRHSA
jgi:lactam utilization protein B